MKTKLLILAGFASSALLVSAADRPAKFGPLPPEKMAANLFADYDVDESGSLDATELVTALSEIRDKRRAENAADCPRNGQGKRGSVQGRRGPPPAEELTVQMMLEFDEDEDLTLNTAELLNALDSMRNRGPRGRPPMGTNSVSSAE